MITMLGIPNCSTIKKARRFLEDHQIDYTFRDVRANPLSNQEWAALVAQDHQRLLINTASPTFRKCGIAKDALDDGTRIELLLRHPTVMKRPTLLVDDHLQLIGFSESKYAQLTN